MIWHWSRSQNGTFLTVGNELADFLHWVPTSWTFDVQTLICCSCSNMAMDQYLLIPFLGGWTSIYQLFWCSPGVQGFDTLPHLQTFFLPPVIFQRSHFTFFTGPLGRTRSFRCWLIQTWTHLPTSMLRCTWRTTQKDGRKRHPGWLFFDEKRLIIHHDSPNCMWGEKYAHKQKLLEIAWKILKVWLVLNRESKTE